jgi:hypothetical protein
MKLILKIMIVAAAAYGIASFLGHEQEAREIVEAAPEYATQALSDGYEKLEKIKPISPAF